MKKKFKTSLIFIIILSASSQSKDLSGNEKINGLYAVRYPYYYKENNTIKGIVGAAAEYALKNSGLIYEWEEIPPVRQLQYLMENNSKIVIIGWFKNKEREQLGKFSIPVYRDRPNVVLFKTGNKYFNNIKSLDTLLSSSNLKLLVKDGYSYGQFIDNKISKSRTVPHKTSADATQMVMMINAGRADYFFVSLEEAEFLIKSAGLKSSDISIKYFPEIPYGEKRYLMFSRKVTDEEIKKINHYLKEYISR